MEKEDLPSDSDLSDDDYCPGNEKVKLSRSEDSSGSENSDDNGDFAQKKSVRNKSNKRIKKLKLKRSTKKSNKENSSDSSDDNSKSDDSDEETAETTTPKVVEDSQKKITRGSLASENKNEHKTIEKDLLDSDEEEKKRSESLWASFMSAEVPSSSNVNREKPQLPEETKSTDKESIPSKTNTVEKQEKVTEILEFAGEEIKVEKSSIEKIRQQPSSGFGRGPKRPSGSSSGLGAVLGQIGKKTKLSVLEKTKLDWTSFKQDQGINEELQTFNKGKDGYLERQDFLQRTDLRQFEIERNLRQARRNKQ